MRKRCKRRMTMAQIVYDDTHDGGVYVLAKKKTFC